MKSAAMNPRVVVGGNNPPSPFEEAEKSITDLYEEAAQWMDGEPVTTEAMAEGVTKIINLLRKAKTAADNARKEEAKPFDEGKAAVQAKYTPLIKKADLAIDTCKNALLPYELAKKKAQEEAAAKARAEAEEKARIAQEALKASRGDNLEERAKAEALADAAKQADTAARQAANAKANTKSTVGRAVGVVTTITPKVKDYAAAARYLWTDPAGRQALEETIDRIVRQAANPLSIPGVEMVEEHSVR